MPITGQPIFAARSMILHIFSPITSPSEPPNTVKSWLKTHTRAPVDRAVAGHHRVAPRPVLLHVEVVGAVAHERVELLEGARVEQLLDALARRVLAARVLLLLGLRARSGSRPRAAPAAGRASPRRSPAPSGAARACGGRCATRRAARRRSGGRASSWSSGAGCYPGTAICGLTPGARAGPCSGPRERPVVRRAETVEHAGEHGRGLLLQLGQLGGDVGLGGRLARARRSGSAISGSAISTSAVGSGVGLDGLSQARRLGSTVAYADGRAERRTRVVARARRSRARARRFRAPRSRPPRSARAWARRLSRARRRPRSAPALAQISARRPPGSPRASPGCPSPMVRSRPCRWPERRPLPPPPSRRRGRARCARCGSRRARRGGERGWSGSLSSAHSSGGDLTRVRCTSEETLIAHGFRAIGRDSSSRPTRWARAPSVVSTRTRGSRAGR